MIIRQFALHSGTGTSRTTKVLTSGEYGFSNPTGLGYTVSPETIDLEYGFFSRTNVNKIPLNSIVGDILIKGLTQDAALTYRELVAWMIAANSADELYFEYKPDENHTYECKVALDYIQKTEKDGIKLICPVSFQMLTPWYVASATTVVKTLDGTYWSSSSWSTLHTFSAASGDIPAAVLIRLYDGSDEFSVPRLQLVGVTSGNVYGTMSMSGSNDEVILSTKYDNSYVHKVNDGVEADNLTNVDITLDPFFHLPTTEQTYLQIKVQTAMTTAKADITVYDYYRAV